MMFVCLVVALAVVAVAAAEQATNLRSFQRPSEFAKMINPKFADFVPLHPELKAAKKLQISQPKKLDTRNLFGERTFTEHLHGENSKSLQANSNLGAAPVIIGSANGWAYANYYASCSASDTKSTPIVVGGSVIGFCQPSQASSGPSANMWVYFDNCNNNVNVSTINRYVFNSSTCASNSYVASASETIPLDSCTSDANNGLFYKFQCTDVTSSLPLFNDQYVAIETSFDSNEQMKCQATPEQFQAYKVNACIPGNHNKSAIGGYSGYKFECSNPANGKATVKARTFTSTSTTNNCQIYDHAIVDDVGCTNQNTGSITTYQDFSCFTAPNVTTLYDDMLPGNYDDVTIDDGYVFPTDGYFVYDYFNGNQCSESNSFSVGYKFNECLVGYDQTGAVVGSIEGTCDSTTQEFIYRQYTSGDCSGSHTTATQTITNKCSPTVEGNSFGGSAQVRCAFGSGLPVNFNSVLVTGFEGSTANTCQASTTSEMTMFMAYAESTNGEATCFPLGQNMSYNLQCANSQATTFTELKFTGSDSCNSRPKTGGTSYPMGCFSTSDPAYSKMNGLLNLNYFSSRLFAVEVSSPEVVNGISNAVVTSPTVGATNQYLQQNFYRNVEDCNTTNPEFDFVTAIEGAIIGQCLVLYNNSNPIGSYKYTCSGGKTAELQKWSGSNCTGTTAVEPIVLNTCQDSLGTSYSATSYSCPVTPDFNDGFAYRLVYNPADTCASDIIEYKGVQQNVCVSLDLRTSQIYECQANNEVVMTTFADGACGTTSTGKVTYPEVCGLTKNQYGVSGPTYTKPYCKPSTGFTTYFTEYYYSLVTDCDANNIGVPPTNFVAAQGYAANTCIVEHDNNGAVGSYKYTCSSTGASKMIYTSTDCSGTPVTQPPVILNTCSNSVGTSYGAYSFACNANDIPLNNGQVYQLKYAANASTCMDQTTEPFIAYSAVNPDICVSTNQQDAKKYQCNPAAGTVSVASYTAPDCSSTPTTQDFPDTCNPISNPTNSAIIGYYSVPYCVGGDDYVPALDDKFYLDDAYVYPDTGTLLYQYVNVECFSTNPNPPNPNPSSSNDDSSSSSLSAGAIAGIAIACAVIVIGVGYFVYAKFMTSKSSSDLNKALVDDQNSGHRVNKTDMYSNNENPILKQSNNRSFDRNT